jgi:hypothetical protein
MRDFSSESSAMDIQPHELLRRKSKYVLKLGHFVPQWDFLSLNTGFVPMSLSGTCQAEVDSLMGRHKPVGGSMGLDNILYLLGNVAQHPPPTSGDSLNIVGNKQETSAAM